MAMVDQSSRGRISVIAFQAPPVNSLGYALRIEMLAALQRAAADPAVEGIVLVGGNGTFSAGADIREFGTPEMIRGPSLWTLNSLLDDLHKPVVAAIEGMALGGGLELAMSCHHRVALATARIGLPEVKLGLLPGAGGTQRLPRLIGVEGALNVMLSGEPLPVALFAKSPLFDKVVEADLIGAAVAVAEASAAALREGKPLPRARDRKVKEPDLQALCQFARNTAKTAFKEYPAPISIIDAVEYGATRSIDAGFDRTPARQKSRHARPLAPCSGAGIAPHALQHPCPHPLVLGQSTGLGLGPGQSRGSGGQISPALSSVYDQITRADRRTSSGALSRVTGLHGLHRSTPYARLNHGKGQCLLFAVLLFGQKMNDPFLVTRSMIGDHDRASLL